ncbi:MAG: rhamnulokinase [Candidatus Aminicenantes bacterium]|nr:rhamnulokinase [Candidatus Aminicenantes bacterium]
MPEPLRFLALDLGAESGRAVLGSLDSERLETTEVHRFPNGPSLLDGGLRWDVPRLFEEIKRGLRRAVDRAGAPPDALAVDTWGVDFGLVDEAGSLLGLPFSYRDQRTRGAMEGFFDRLPRRAVYYQTGIQFLPFNTLFQLFSMVRDRSPLLERAAGLLFMPDIFHCLLSGEQATEFSVATTSQLYDPRRGDWSAGIFDALGLPRSLMQSPLEPGTVIGPLSGEAARETGLGGLPVVASLTHDTAAAVAAVPAEGRDWAYISSGTWSLVGVETDAPVIDDRSLRLNFTNEGGIGRTVRLLKNVTGLWLVRQCRKTWEGRSPESSWDYETLTRLAEDAPRFRTFLDPDSPEFLNPEDMPAAIQDCARRSGQPVPEAPGGFVRCILESLALKYAAVLDELEVLTGRPIRTVHVIGGGARNALLNRFTASASGRTVIAGPDEASSCGNVLGQALALGHIRSRDEARSIVRNSTRTLVFQPEGSGGWEKARARFREVAAPGATR